MTRANSGSKWRATIWRFAPERLVVDGFDKKAFRHPDWGRILPGNPFRIGDSQHPANALEVWTEEHIRELGIEISDDPTITEDDAASLLRHEEREKANQQMDTEKFAALGRFVQQFEHMVESVRNAMSFILMSRGASWEDLVVIFNNESLTAKPLWDMFDAMIARRLHTITGPEKAAEREAAIEILEQLRRDYGAAIKMRNRNLHATWSIGWRAVGDDPDEEISARKVKPKPTDPRGFTMHEMPRDIASLDRQTAHCLRTKLTIDRFWYCAVSHDNAPSILKNFKKIDDPVQPTDGERRIGKVRQIWVNAR